VLAAARDLGVELVVTVTGAEADALVGVPDGVRVVRGLSLHLLLPHCAAVVHQGGNGTLLTAAYHGVPQLVLPQLPDQTFHTERFVATGAGSSLRAADTTEDTIRAALTDLLGQPRYRSAAHDLQAEMHATPTPADLVPQLEAVAGL
jgi:UDP:flavonoid glycosyltransferase YjiC (YdhE family)